MCASFDDAISYVEAVKQAYATSPQVFQQFLEIMKSFKMGILDTHGVMSQVGVLFSGRPKLILGFDLFLPSGYSMRDEFPGLLVEGGVEVVEEGDSPENGVVDFGGALSFVSKVKLAFAEKREKFEEFLQILRRYAVHKDVSRVSNEMQKLLGDYPQLLAQFPNFLPKAPAVANQDANV